MKILSKSEIHMSNIERYNLNETFSENGFNKGLMICYALSNNESIKFLSLDVESRPEELGIMEGWHYNYSESSFKEIFPSSEKFLKAFDDEDFGRWSAKFIYQNTEVQVIGEKDDTEITVSYSKEFQLKLLSLLSSVEKTTYEYNGCNKLLLNILKNDYKMTEKRAVLSIQKLQSHKDIYEEFESVVTLGGFPIGKDVICVEGFTAEKLNRDYPLSVLGAYNYLIYLRECPLEAKEDLRKGLPRK